MKKFSYLFVFTFLVFSCNNDDDLIAACDKASNISATNITTTSATISWSDINNAGSYLVEYGVSGFSFGAGTIMTETATTTTLDNLLPETTYDVYVQVVCTADNVSMLSEVFSFTTVAEPVIPEFRNNLSELNLFSGDLAELNPSVYTFEYDLHSTLFSDYAHKQRLIALPNGTKMTYDGNGLPLFPENTVIAKTFYYNNDETNLSLGKKIIETRILIKINGIWESGDYRWNDAQTNAVLDLDGGDVPVTWVDADGTTQSITYEIPSNTDCFTCHESYDNLTPIGPKLRALNFSDNGTNQIQALIDSQLLEGLADPSTVSVLPKWDDEDNYSLEERARAYIDVNCAHCHTDGGFCEDQSILRISFETAFEESGILNRKNSILTRIQSTIPEYGMPYIGTTILHDDGVDLMMDYLNSLD